MNKLHNIQYGFMMLYWTFQQWQVLMFPHIPCEGETHEDCDMENLRLCLFQYLNNCEGDYD